MFLHFYTFHEQLLYLLVVSFQDHRILGGVHHMLQLLLEGVVERYMRGYSRIAVFLIRDARFVH